MSSPTSRPRSRRPDLSFADMLRGVSVLAVGVLLAGWLGGLFRSDTVVEPRPVDYVTVAQQAQEAAPFDLAVPPPLPEGWRATSARWDAVEQQWHLGILTADDEYVGIEQSDEDLGTVLQEHAEGSTAAGVVEVSGRPWRRFVDEQSGEVALARETPPATTLVTGTVPEGTLVAVAQTLGG